MGWRYHVIEDPATGTGASDDEFHLPVPYPGKTLILYSSTSLGDVTADLQIKTPLDGWEDAHDDNGKITLSASRNPEVVYGPGTFRLNFTTRTNSVGAAITDIFDSSV